MSLPYHHRTEAGQVLTGHLAHYAGRPDLLVLALPRGGVPVAYEVARALPAPLDLMLVRKLGVPGHEELAMGAIAAGGVRVLNEDVVRMLAVPPRVVEAVAAREAEELHRRQQAYRSDRPPPSIAGRCVIVIDDGLATGASMHAAVSALRAQGPARIVAAAPVGSIQAVEMLRPEVDEVVCPATPPTFQGVGQWYEDFAQTTDEEVRDLLAAAWKQQG